MHSRARWTFGGVVLLLLGAAFWPEHGEESAKDGPRLSPREFSPAAAVRPDRPDAAFEYYRAKRRPAAGGIDPLEAYRKARKQTLAMRRYSTRQGEFVPYVKGRSSVGRTGSGASRAARSWEWLGPSNIGGRTRTLVIHPQKPRIMYAGGVSGGVWKTTTSGRKWRTVGDEMANLAVNAMAMDPSNPRVLYVGTGEGYFREVVRVTGLPLRGAGIFKTENGGRTWIRLESTHGKAFRWVNDLVLSPHDSRRIYAATRSGVFRSTDGGTSWTRTLKPRVRGGCLDLAMRTDRPGDFLFASCGTFEQATVYRNTRAESARKWRRVLSDPGMGRTSLAVAPSDQDIVYALAASNAPGPEGRFEQALHGVFRSTAGGSRGSWQARLRNTDPRKINTLLLSNPILAFLEECGFEGANSHLAMGWYVNVIAVDPADPDTVWAAGVDLFRSPDGGRNWTPMTYWWSEPNANFVHADHHGVVFHPRKPTTMFALNDGGIYRTRNAVAPASESELAVCQPGSAAVAWRSLNNGYGPTQFYHGVAFPAGRSYIAGAQDNGTLLGGDDRPDKMWTRIFGGDGGYSAVDPTNTDVIFVTFQNGQIRKSTDGGVTFSPATNGITDLENQDSRSDFRATVENFLFVSPLVMDPNNPRRLWFGGRRLWSTDDAADRWIAASEPLLEAGKVSAIAVANGDSDRVLVGAHDGYIYRTDRATAVGPSRVWTAVRPREGWVSSVALDPIDHQVAYATYAGFGGEHVWKSRDGGATWTAIDGRGSGAVPDIPVHALVVDPANRSRLYLGTDLGVLVSVDSGESWAVEESGFANLVTEWLTISPEASGERYLFAFTHGRGAWRVRLEAAGS